MIVSISGALAELRLVRRPVLLHVLGELRMTACGGSEWLNRLPWVLVDIYIKSMMPF